MRLFYSAFAVAMLSLFSADVSAENYLVREDRVWEYRAAPGYSSGAVSISYKLYFEGDTVVDGKRYNILRTKDSTRYMWDGPGTPYVPEKIDDGLPFLLREEDGKVYVHAPIEGYGEYEYWGDGSPSYWSSADTEALLYDFNANVGDEMTVVGSWGEKLQGKVDSTFTVDVNGTPCNGYAFLPDDMAMPFQVIEGLGNISIGSIPYYVIDFPTRAIPSLNQELVRVTDLDGNVICEKTGGEWPWEKPAQTGSIVREDRVWNYTLDKFSYENISTVGEVGGYHFSGTRDVDGQTYSVFLDGDDKEVALMRQDGGKVYRYLEEELRNCLLLSENRGENLEEMYGDNPTEIMLYNFDAQPGDSFYMPVFDDSSYFEMCEFTVEAVRDINISGEMMTFQYLSGGYVIVNGIGPDHGMLHCPELGWLNTGMTNYYYFIKDVFDSNGKELFRRNDFDSKKHHTLIRKDREWEYRGSTRNDVFYTYKMHFGGTQLLDSQMYTVLHTDSGIQKTWDFATDDWSCSPIENGLTFLLRDDWGKIYVHAPVDQGFGYFPWNIPDKEALLYDFNAKEGDKMTVINSYGDLITGTVTTTFVVEVAGESCRGYKILFDENPNEYTVIEGMGNITLGCMPYFVDALPTSYGGNMNYVPVCEDYEVLEKITDLRGNVICEKTDGKWPWERPDGVSTVEADGAIVYDGNAIEAADSDIIVFDLSGNRVAEGRGSVSTAGLQPGVYVAKTAGQSLKIVVR